jgi:hypothetical protein
MKPVYVLFLAMVFGLMDCVQVNRCACESCVCCACCDCAETGVCDCKDCGCKRGK